MNSKNRFFSKIFWITLLFKQNRYHRYGVFLHTLKVLLGVLKDRNYKYIAVALFHDIGKPFMAYQDEEDKKTGEYSFTDHEEKSYQIVKNWFFLSLWTKNMIRYHYIIRDIQRSKEKNNLKRLARLEHSWGKLDSKFVKNLEIFLKYDDYGKH
jgi:CRISPR/Cas system-associated endonuclease Cas3-HD